MAEKDEAFVEYVVKAIVDNPDKVSVSRKVDEMGVLIELEVDPADMGKIIGKDGRTAKAIRTLLRVLGAQINARVNLKVLEPEGGLRSQGMASDAPASDMGMMDAPSAEMPTVDEGPATTTKDDLKDLSDE